MPGDRRLRAYHRRGSGASIGSGPPFSPNAFGFAALDWRAGAC